MKQFFNDDYLRAFKTKRDYDFRRVFNDKQEKNEMKMITEIKYEYLKLKEKEDREEEKKQRERK